VEHGGDVSGGGEGGRKKGAKEEREGGREITFLARHLFERGRRKNG